MTIKRYELNLVTLSVLLPNLAKGSHIKAGLGLGVPRRKVTLFVLAEVGYEFFYPLKGVREVLRNHPADYTKARLFCAMGLTVADESECLVYEASPQGE